MSRQASYFESVGDRIVAEYTDYGDYAEPGYTARVRNTAGKWVKLETDHISYVKDLFETHGYEFPAWR